jgi:hypothetical protein
MIASRKPVKQHENGHGIEPISTAGSPSIWPVWMRATPANSMKCPVRRQRRLRSELDRLAAKLDEDDRNTLVEGEPDARPMGIGKGPKPPSYNVQTAVDAETGLIIHHEVTGESSFGQLLLIKIKA